MLKKISLKTKHETQMISLTEEVTEFVIKSGIKEGIVTVFTQHTTTSIMMFEKLDANLQRDLLGTLKYFLPTDKDYSHVGDNAAAHLKSAMNGSTVTIPVSEGRPLFGPWQGVYFAEFDGPREDRAVLIKVIAG